MDEICGEIKSDLARKGHSDLDVVGAVGVPLAAVNYGLVSDISHSCCPCHVRNIRKTFRDKITHICVILQGYKPLAAVHGRGVRSFGVLG